MTDLLHIYTLTWHDDSGVQMTMTTDPEMAEAQARAGAFVTADSWRVA